MPAPTARPPAAQTVEWEKFKGLNLTDARTAIGDDEFSWIENAITVGDGQIQIVPGPGDPVATIDAGIVTLWGLVLDGVPLFITINGDGSIDQVTPGGVVTSVAGPGTVSGAAHVTIWRDAPVLIVDPLTGYFKWDGTTFSVIDPAITGQALAVFEGRVWIADGRTITYTAPNTFDNVDPADGAGSYEITDEAFSGNIVALVSALEQLWVVGESAIDAISNVTAVGTAPNVTTSFTTTNIVTNIGSATSASVLGYFRALAFMSPAGIYALSGVTPQKLSDKIDDLFTDLILTPETPAAVATVLNLQALVFLTTYTGAQAFSGPAPLPLLLVFIQGKLFLAVQGLATSWITTLVVDGVSQAWGTDGSTIYQLFGASRDAAITYKVQSKLFKFGKSTTVKQATKVGFEFQAANPVAPTFTLDSEGLSEIIPPQVNNQIASWLNAMGNPVAWVNNVGTQVTFLSQGMVLSRQAAKLRGQYLGWTLTGDDPPYRVQAIQMEYVPSREWNVPA